ncbi:MMPL family transporter [Marilutibacter aestuarii]|uniref:MMPL family transporter n=1 Tax=Marilutibacter aestuarii TaxID=1706195 RepID=A0A508AUD4_9GAMM|nr:MMPL family transporter [Lysobacter aestuarii]TQD51308.1 MMPL family transporter [Lysobacter aestuarii]
MTLARRLGLAVLWLAVLGLAGAWIARHLEVSGDLRHFMPTARTPSQKLLIEELGEGPGARLLLVALSGDAPGELARQSLAMRDALDGDPRFSVVANGHDGGLDAIPEALRPYRYMLSPTVDGQRFDRAWLQEELDQRVQDLGSPAAAQLEALLPRDPTLETLRLADAWTPATAPELWHGVWFTPAPAADLAEATHAAPTADPAPATEASPRRGAGDREALMLLETRAAGFDPQGQQAALAAVRAAFDEVRGESPARLSITGPGAFSVEIGERTRREATLFGTLGGVGFGLMLLVAYRRWQVPLQAALPVATAGLAGLAAVALVFSEQVHGITLAFGFTLIGIAADYPIHLLSHQRPGRSAYESARTIWKTLATGVASTCLAYLTFFVSGVDGLRQLAVFTVAGLATAALSTRFLLPAVLDPVPRDVADLSLTHALLERVERLPRMNSTFSLGLAGIAAAAVVFVPGAFWENDLARLTPVPEAALARDLQLRHALGAPDVRYMIAVEGADADAVLAHTERMRPALDALRAQGAVADYDMAARYLPSLATQRARQDRLPTREALQAELDAAVAGTPFRPDAFGGFIDDVETARTARPLSAGDVAGTPLETRIGGLLLQSRDRATALVTLTGLVDPAAVAHVAKAEGATLLDLKGASESLVAEYRERVLWALGLAVVLLALGVGAVLRHVRRTMRVMAPMLLSTVLVVAVLRMAGVELNLFHLVALMLAAGLGLDYALFFDHAGHDRAEQRRTLHALIVCAISTLLVFALLGLSSIPVLRAIGSTVALGVLFNLSLAVLVTRRREGMA